MDPIPETAVPIIAITKYIRALFLENSPKIKVSPYTPPYPR
jgi:hypothetical protein